MISGAYRDVLSGSFKVCVTAGYSLARSADRHGQSDCQPSFSEENWKPSTWRREIVSWPPTGEMEFHAFRWGISDVESPTHLRKGE